MTESTGTIKFVVRYGGSPIAGAKIYTSTNRITYYYRGYTSGVGVLMATGLPSGINYYMVSAQGYNAAYGYGNVPANGGIEIDVYMSKSLSIISADMVGNLTVISDPDGACVYINDVMQEIYTPVTISDIPEGDYILKLVKDGYEDLITPITIIKGQTTEITLSLTQI
jgi:hypothetical protein